MIDEYIRNGEVKTFENEMLRIFNVTLRISIQDSLFRSQGELLSNVYSAFNSTFGHGSPFTQHPPTRQPPLWFYRVCRLPFFKSLV